MILVLYFKKKNSTKRPLTKLMMHETVQLLYSHNFYIFPHFGEIVVTNILLGRSSHFFSAPVHLKKGHPRTSSPRQKVCNSNNRADEYIIFIIIMVITVISMHAVHYTPWLFFLVTISSIPHHQKKLFIAIIRSYLCLHWRKQEKREGIKSVPFP